MDIAFVVGLIVAIGSILGSDLMQGGQVAALINASAALLVVGGTVGVTAVSHSLADMLTIPGLIGEALHDRTQNLQPILERIVAFAVKARREGLLSLESELADLDEPFLKRGLQMVVDGADPEMVRSVLETEIASVQRRQRRSAQIFETAGGYAPTMGIIGTVMGLIHVLSNLSDASRLGPSIAEAFLATFYGIATANVFWLPVGAKLKSKGAAHLASRELMLEGILSIQRGDNPSIVRDKLQVHLGTKPPQQKSTSAAGRTARQPGGETA